MFPKSCQSCQPTVQKDKQGSRGLYYNKSVPKSNKNGQLLLAQYLYWSWHKIWHSNFKTDLVRKISIKGSRGKSVPMLPPLLGIFPPIHPPIEACPDLPGPLFLAAITTGTCSTDGSPTLKEAIGRIKKKISKKLLLLIFSNFCCHLNQSDRSTNWSRDLTIAPKQ